MQEFFTNNADTILSLLVAVITAVFGYLGTLYKTFVNNKTKRDIVEDTVKYIEQISTSLGFTSEEKLAKAKEKAIEWLKAAGIKCSDTELEVLIESAVNSFTTSSKTK